jgi:hypothetical protein
MSENVPNLASLCRHAALQLADEANAKAELVDATVGDLTRTQKFTPLQRLAGLGRRMARIRQRLCDISDDKDALVATRR